MPQDPEGSDTERGHSSPASGSFEGDMLALLPRLRRYSRSLTRSDSESDDLLQDCLEKALANRQRWRGDNLRSWVYTIMTNLQRNRHRDRMRHPAENLDDYEHLAGSETASDILQNERLHEALAQLHPDARSVLILVVVEGYTYQEVAGILDIPVGTVMSRLSRARHSLRERLQSDNIIHLRRPR